MGKVRRILDCTKSDFEKMSALDLKESILAAEGRTILAQNYVGFTSGLIDGITNTELEAAFGADMIMLNGYSLDESKEIPGLLGMRLKDVKKLVNRPIGIYLECPDPNSTVLGERREVTADRIASAENIEKCLKEGADFVVLGGNPGTGTTFESIIAATKLAKNIVGDKILIFAGKWEDGTVEKVLGDPLAKRLAKEVIKDLIDGGADVITLPAPGSRHGISIDMIRECVEFVHSYKPGTLAMVFLDSSVEGADVDTIRQIALKMKETGADIHAIGDGGYAGVTVPENLYQLSITIRGRRLTWKRMAGNNR
ncbi:hypothetical protein SAMN04324257_00031 [Thermoanaerobacter thermohydrosulfuricus]|nr:hypothetical protein SAMN04324257_00031 [Thermoanaerobacter thermohydrosulfuricus]